MSLAVLMNQLLDIGFALQYATAITNTVVKLMLGESMQVHYASCQQAEPDCIADVCKVVQEANRVNETCLSMHILHLPQMLYQS